ncbi:hypothetical protein ABZ478_12330 [Streptomyces sp. NPDC005706]|uniref:hypothetical protein n=1 Tax=Streptomyces sp. NPDC005706 TaxID=3157169 RepID=UPI0033C48724
MKFAKRCAAVSAAVTAAVLFSAGGAQADGVGDALPLLRNVTLLQISYPSMDQVRTGDAATRALKAAKDDDPGTITVNCNQQQQQQQQQAAADPAAAKALKTTKATKNAKATKSTKSTKSTKALKTVKKDDGNTVTIDCNQQQQQQQQQAGQ